MQSSDDAAAMVAGIGPEKRSHAERERSAQALAELAARRPDLVLPYWDILAGYLKSANSFSQFAAAGTLAELAASKQGAIPFQDVFEDFFGLLSSGKVMVAGRIAKLAGPLAVSHPDWESEITSRLLSIGRGKLDPERADLVKGYAIEAFSEYWERSSSKQAILTFVEDQRRHSKSPATKQRAEAFLARFATAGQRVPAPEARRIARRNP